MTEDLRERLADLAGDAPSYAGGSSADLWRRGRRRRVREQLVAGVAVLALLAGLGSLLGLLALGDARPAPVAPTGSLAIPDRMFAPSPWTAGTKGDPIGPLVAVFGASRYSWHGITQSSRSALVGVSAVTGEYRFLDLPGATAPHLSFSTPTPSLSPDGEYVGYWLAGRVRDDRGVLGDGVTGFAVYDTRTGETFRHPAQTSMGLNPLAIAWTKGRAWFNYGIVDSLTGDSSAATYGPGSVMSLVDGTVTAGAELSQFNQPTSGPDGILMGGRRLLRVTAPGRTTLIATVPRRLVQPALSPDGGYLVALPERSTPGRDGQLLVAEVGGTGARRDLTLRALPGVLATDVLGWRDPLHAVVLDGIGQISSVDVRTGRSSRLVDMTQADVESDAQLANGLLSAPMVGGERPPDVPDPRARALLLGGVGLGGLVVLIGGALWVGRRRERA